MHVDLKSSELPIVVDGVGMVRWLDIGRCLEVVNVIFMIKVLRLPRHVRSEYNMWVRFQFSGVGGGHVHPSKAFTDLDRDMVTIGSSNALCAGESERCIIYM